MSLEDLTIDPEELLRQYEKLTGKKVSSVEHPRQENGEVPTITNGPGRKLKANEYWDKKEKKIKRHKKEKVKPEPIVEVEEPKSRVRERQYDHNGEEIKIRCRVERFEPIKNRPNAFDKMTIGARDFNQRETEELAAFKSVRKQKAISKKKRVNDNYINIKCTKCRKTIEVHRDMILQEDIPEYICRKCLK